MTYYINNDNTKQKINNILTKTNISWESFDKALQNVSYRDYKDESDLIAVNLVDFVEGSLDDVDYDEHTVLGYTRIFIHKRDVSIVNDWQYYPDTTPTIPGNYRVEYTYEERIREQGYSTYTKKTKLIGLYWDGNEWDYSDLNEELAGNFVSMRYRLWDN